jgi:hypothetical protein
MEENRVCPIKSLQLDVTVVAAFFSSLLVLLR